MCPPFLDAARKWTIKLQHLKLERLIWVSGPLMVHRTQLSSCMWFVCGGTALYEPWCSKAIFNDNISNPASQLQNSLLSSAATNPFTQEHTPVLGGDSLSASGDGIGSRPPRVKVPPGFECGFAQG